MTWIVWLRMQRQKIKLSERGREKAGDGGEYVDMAMLGSLSFFVLSMLLLLVRWPLHLAAAQLLLLLLLLSNRKIK